MSELQTASDHLSAAQAILARVLAAEKAPAAAGEGAPAAAADAPGLRDPAQFFAVVRAAPPLGPTLTDAEVTGCERILTACHGLPVSWAAYILATAVHETAGQLRPIAEYGKGRGRDYGRPGRNRGQIAYGRGDVQLTWDANYERADRELGLNGRLIDNYELALDPVISSKILVAGMTGGWFTGKSLNDYLPAIATRAQFVFARRIVNGTDKADLIAGYAMTFQQALQAAGWRP